MKDKLRRFLRDDRTFIGVLVLILISIAATVGEAVFSSLHSRAVCAYISAVLTGIFVLELLIRWYVADSFLAFLKDCWIEILAVIPVARTFRLLRLMRLLRLVNWGVRARRQRKLQSYGSFFSDNVALIMVPLVLIIGASVAILKFESGAASFSSPGRSFLWSISTLMAGEPIYGEPSSLGGKLVASLLMLAGFVFFALFTGVVSSYIMRMLRDEVGIDADWLATLSNHFIICGWSPAAPILLEELRSAEDTRHLDIVVISKDKPDYEMRPHKAKGELLFVQGDFTSGELLDKVKIQTAHSAVFLAQGNADGREHDARNVLAALIAEKMCVRLASDRNMYSCVELLVKDADKTEILQAAQVDDVLEGSEFLGHFIAHSVSVDGLNYILDDLMTSAWGGEFQIITSELDGCFSDVARRYKNSFESILMGYRESDGRGRFTINPPPDSWISKESQLLVIGRTCALAAAKKGATTGRLIPRSKIGPSAGPKKRVVICGYNRAVPHLINELSTHSEMAQAEVVLIAESDFVPAGLGDIQFISGNYTSASVLREAKIHLADVAIILSDTLGPRGGALDADARAILTALTIEKHNERVISCVELRSFDEQKINILRSAHVEIMVGFHNCIGNLIAQSIRSPGLSLVLSELLTSNFGNQFNKEVVSLNEASGQTFGDRFDHGVASEQKIIVGLRRKVGLDQYHYLTNPPQSEILRPGDELYMIVRATDNESIPDGVENNCRVAVCPT